VSEVATGAGTFAAASCGPAKASTMAMIAIKRFTRAPVRLPPIIGTGKTFFNRNEKHETLQKSARAKISAGCGVLILRRRHAANGNGPRHMPIIFRPFHDSYSPFAGTRHR
jgi:hypothetical protein